MMTLLPTTLGIVAGFCGHVGVIHVLVGWRRPEKALHLTFAFLCFCVVGVALSSVALYQADTVATYALAIKWQLACVYVLAMLLPWFIASYTGVRPVWFLLALNCICILALVINLAAPFGLFFTSLDGITQIMMPWGERIASPTRTTLSPWVALVRWSLVGLQLYGYYACYRQYRRGERRAALLLALGLSTALFARWHDHLALASGAPGLSWVEYGFMTLVVIMGLSLLADLIRVGIIKQSLVANERRWRELLESVELAVVGLADDGRIDYVNPHYLHLTGFAPADVLGQTLTTFVPAYDHPRLEVLAAQVRDGTAFPPYVQLPLRTRAGDERVMAWSNVRLRGPDGRFTGLLSVGADITERLVAEAEIHSLNAELEQRVAARTAELWATNRQLEEQRQLAERRRRVAEHLSDLLDLLNTDPSITTIWQKIAAAITPLFAVDATAIYQYADGVFTPLATSDGSTDAAVRLLQGSQPALGQALDSGQPVIICEPDTARALVMQTADGAPIAPHIDGVYVSALAVPLVSGGSFVGGIIFGYTTAHTFTSDEIALAAAFGDQVVLVIDNAQLRRQVAVTAATEERTRLARDLHDAVTQTLYAIAVIAEALPMVWERRPQEARTELVELRRLAQGALAEMRALLVELYPSALVERPLGDLLQQLAEALLGRTRMLITTVVVGERTLPNEVQVALYRIAQEALNNSVKHAGARQAWVNLTFDGAQVTLQVRDNGHGFDPLVQSGHGFGLRTMGERASAIGATFAIARQPDAGIAVRVSWTSAQLEQAYAANGTDSCVVGMRSQTLAAKAIGS